MPSSQEKGAITVQSKFYCNIKALTAAERARHKLLTEKLISVRKEVVETEKGYEFQYGPADVTLAELAEWVVAEGSAVRFLIFTLIWSARGFALFAIDGEEGLRSLFGRSFGGGK